MCNKCEAIRGYISRCVVHDFPESNERSEAANAAFMMAAGVAQENLTLGFLGYAIFHNVAHEVFTDEYADRVMPGRLTKFLLECHAVYHPEMRAVDANKAWFDLGKVGQA